jgi:hypothetical protein
VLHVLIVHADDYQVMLEASSHMNTSCDAAQDTTRQSGRKCIALVGMQPAAASVSSRAQNQDKIVCFLGLRFKMKAMFRLTRLSVKLLRINQS